MNEELSRCSAGECRTILFLLAGFLILVAASFAGVNLFKGQLYTVLSASGYLPIHIVIELFSILVAFLIFIVGWVPYRKGKNDWVVLISGLALGVGLIDLMHLLSFPGMPDFITPSSTNKGILFWIPARLLFACAVLAGALVAWRPMARVVMVRSLSVGIALGISAAVFVAAIFFESSVPAMFVPGAGLTPLKIGLEYLTVGILAAGGLVMLVRFVKTREHVFGIYLAAVILSIFSELAFTLYQSAYDTFNLLGHLYKVLAYCFIYVGVYRVTVKAPFDTLARATARLREDIATRARIERALREEEEELNEAQHLGRFGSWKWDRATNKITWSKENYEIFGFDPEQPLPTYEEHLDAYTPESAARLDAAVKKNLETGETYELDLELADPPSGAARWILARSETVRDAKGNIIGLSGTSQDVTERKSDFWFLESLDRVNRAIQGTDDLEQMMHAVLNVTLTSFGADRAWLFYPCDPSAPTFRVPMEVSKPEYPGAGILNEDVPMPPDMAKDLQEALTAAEPVTFREGTERPINKVSAEQFKVKSMIMTALYPKTGKPWAFGLHQCATARVWSDKEKRLFKEISYRIADSLNSLLAFRDLERLSSFNEALLLSVPTPVFYKDNDGRYLGCNQAFTDIMGVTSEEMKGKTVMDLWPSDMAQVYHEKDLELMRSPARQIYEYKIKDKDGNERPVIYAKDVFRDEKGKVAGIVGAFLDISERKKAEDELRDLKVKDDALLLSIGEGIVAVDKNGQVILVNAALERIMNSKGSDMLGKQLEEVLSLVRPDGSSFDGDRPIRSALAQGVMVGPVEAHVVRPDGLAVPVEVIASPVLVNGELVGVIDVIRDLSQDKALANDLSKFKLALDNTSDQVLITDPEGIVVYANPAIEKVTGYTPQEVIGKKSGALWKSPMPVEFYKQLWHTIKDEKNTFVGELQNRRKDGEPYDALLSISPVLDKNDKIIFFVGIERDISVEKATDRAKNEFISLASHQMRTPLTVISWYTEMLQGSDAGRLNKKQQAYFHEIYDATRRMNDILKSFLNILRLEAKSITFLPVAVDLAKILEDVVSEFTLDIKRQKLTFIKKIEPKLPNVETDADMARIIIQNIISNAIKYTLAGGKIAVSLTRQPGGSTVAGRAITEDALLIDVADSGIGIVMQDREKVFDKFFRAENAKKLDPNGNGLGLYMVKFMVEHIGGSIWFESEPGKGTTFHFLVPIKQKALQLNKTN